MTAQKQQRRRIDNASVNAAIATSFSVYLLAQSAPALATYLGNTFSKAALRVARAARQQSKRDARDRREPIHLKREWRRSETAFLVGTTPAQTAAPLLPP